MRSRTSLFVSQSVLKERFDTTTVEPITPRYNIAPGDELATITTQYNIRPMDSCHFTRSEPHAQSARTSRRLRSESARHKGADVVG